MKVEERENINKQHVNLVYTTTVLINNNHYSENEITEKITQKISMYEKDPNIKGKPAFKKGVIFDVDTHIARSNADTSIKKNQIGQQNLTNQINFYNKT